MIEVKKKQTLVKTTSLTLMITILKEWLICSTTGAFQELSKTGWARQICPCGNSPALTEGGSNSLG